MSQWVRKGIQTGIKTTAYPAREETAAGVSPGRPVGGDYSEQTTEALIACCPTQALSQIDHRLVVDYRRCVHCFRCRDGLAASIAWQQGYEWAGAAGDEPPSLGDEFSRCSIHILVVDAGDCGACLNEVKQLNNPYYNMHRLGFFITPTPRQADILLVVGPGTDQMRLALRKAYEAMPAPKRVVAVGTCALSGSVFGPSFVSAGGISQILPVDIEIPGQPPPPLAILHGLLAVVGRKAPVSLISPAPMAADKEGV
ncbi:MAG: NADH:ubiquinone oxidoreductase [Deltaproteobacteria bacterium]|nr:NADH:ubiquinone oxidoreductase [Deltaproteobacteria bacterium]